MSESEKARVFVIDDEESVIDFLSITLKKFGFEVVGFTSPKKALKALEEGESPDAVLTDLRMEEMNGLAVLREIRGLEPQLPVIMMSAYATLESAIEALRLGAFDYILKPFKIDEIRAVLQRAVETVRLRQENLYLRRELRRTYDIKNLVGKSPQFQELLRIVERVAATDATVLLTGESGTGKELIARAIHNLSRRSHRPFVAINMAAIPEELLESELFGHVKGAFTGAIRDKVGLFKAAHGGTILLDEISEASPRIQSKLLRVLQEKEITPVGGTRSIKVDVRVIAATNADLPALVREGKFREDLFFRLNVVPIRVPPLRERKEDIPLLVEHFLRKYCAEYGIPRKRVSPKAMEALMNYSWPGNVRELENLIERLVVLSEKQEITVSDLPQQILSQEVVLSPSQASKIDQDLLVGEELPTLEELEKRYIFKVLELTGGDKRKAASILDIDPSTLYRKLHRYAAAEKKG